MPAAVVAAAAPGAAGMTAVTSGLAGLGSLGGLTTGTMAGGLFVVGALPLAVAGAGALACFGAYKLIKRKKKS